jgi:hypothetical protein
MPKASRIHDHQAPIADVCQGGPEVLLSTDCKSVNAETCRSIEQLTLRSKAVAICPNEGNRRAAMAGAEGRCQLQGRAGLPNPRGAHQGKGSSPTEHILFRDGDAISELPKDCVQRSLSLDRLGKRFNEAPSQRPIQGHTLKSINQRRPIRSLACIFTTIKRSEFPGHERTKAGQFINNGLDS